MARLGWSSEVVITALNTDRTQVLVRRLSLCGNGVLDLNEQCDGQDTCTDQCTCLNGMEFSAGKCIDGKLQDLFTKNLRISILVVCGNGIVTGSEECDSGAGCNATTCKCMAGYQPYVNRQECQRIPSEFIPSVGPSLDCLNIIDTNYMVLYFSFVNNNGFDLTIPFGDLNNFIPTDLGVSLTRPLFNSWFKFNILIIYWYIIQGDRPTFFAAGNSLTYPVSPYNFTVPRATSSVVWLLGSYNLTVDLSGNKAEALQCPKGK